MFVAFTQYCLLVAHDYLLSLHVSLQYEVKLYSDVIIESLIWSANYFFQNCQ